ncbi:MAG: single-stranded-DNA-specific exonuclease RecJ [Jaaginema sp. PMC 1079.18]|nr:single-stranded-DNA-specific exonuclease RecJ [Jaaginema sp. PMC 1080.18]MEC4852241.1 single-stranded-DNA-specific exonuclease RecJ [Jaaginema sp. PMC 1079.18]MEC4866226.1 single-stranded-DNA-specific exonuclease RecJ [Jaaginema sp. PMC 1078.18]
MTPRLPEQRWYIAETQPQTVAQLIAATGVLPLIAQVMANRGINTPEQAQAYIDPESETLPPPLAEFPDLEKSIELLRSAIAEGEKIAICGDYDADGMTSTALLIRALRHLGADVNYAIPSRMKDGYGINERIVEELANAGVGLILTVDNGISAYKPVALAIELGLTVIITDHHDLPKEIPPADAILNPKLIREDSPYRSLAGVGVAYILAITLAQKLNSNKGLTYPLLELFTLGTIADLAPLTGVNRRWLKRGLRRLPNSELVGIQELMKVAGVDDQQKALRPDDIGFKLGPRINAIGRIGNPEAVIDLLTTDDPGFALEKAMVCEQTNKQRQNYCEEIFTEAVLLIENEPKEDDACASFYDYQKHRVLVIVQPHWHHGVIGIVASRLVERYGAPVFIGAYEEKDTSIIRGSARGIPEFNVHQALVFCDDIIGKYGGHKAAGGFNLQAENLQKFQQRLSEFAHQHLQPEHIKPLVKIDAEAQFNQLNHHFFKMIDSLHPWGIGNDEPVFWTLNVQVVEQRIVGKNHLKATVAQNIEGEWVKMKAIAWRSGEFFPLPPFIDIAYKLSENHWNDTVNIELEIVGLRPSSEVNPVPPAPQKAAFEYKGRPYHCHLVENELRIKNPQGKVLAVTKGQRTGLLGKSRDDAKTVDVTLSPYYEIIKTAIASLNPQ